MELPTRRRDRILAQYNSSNAAWPREKFHHKGLPVELKTELAFTREAPNMWPESKSYLIHASDRSDFILPKVACVAKLLY